VSVRWIRPGEKLATDRERALVCLVDEGRSPAANVDADALMLLVRGTASEVPLMLVGVGREDQLARAAAGLDRELLALELRHGAKLPEQLQSAAAIAGAADLVLLHSRCHVPAGWLERLAKVASSDGVVATATPLTSDSPSVGVDPGESGDPDGLVVGAAARTRPRLLIGGPHCIYVRRRALDLVDGFSGAHETLEAAIAAISERCLYAGMVNVVADDLYVRCDPPSPPQADPPGRLQELDRSDERSPLRRSVLTADAALGGLSVTIDARSLGPLVGGTQRYTLELVTALARFTDARVRAVIAHDIDPNAAAELDEAPGVELITYDQAVAGVAPSHVVHRPQQVFSTADLSLLALLGHRVVITHQDLIAYHNPACHETLETWEQHRRITRVALAVADRVVFFSEHSRRDALAEDLVSPERCEVIGAAVAGRSANGLTPPAAAPRDRDFILCLGSDYRHKNRVFAIALTQALRAERGWTGQLVLAGAHVPHGSSRGEEESFLSAAPAMREAVVDLGGVTDGERAWLLANARAVLVPSVVEGFGLVPLEAAQVGVPCLFAAESSLIEVIEESLATLVPWDASKSAARAMPLLLDGPQRDRHVECLRASGRRWSWKRIAVALVACYSRTLRSPYPPAAARAWQELQRESYLTELDRSHRSLLDHLGDRVALASDEGFLTAEQQRGLLMLGSRPVLARAALWPFAVLGAIGRERRRGS
jgi:glycosyltransferase involved in cell wall biosynthesis